MSDIEVGRQDPKIIALEGALSGEEGDMSIPLYDWIHYRDRYYPIVALSSTSDIPNPEEVRLLREWGTNVLANYRSFDPQHVHGNRAYEFPTPVFRRNHDGNWSVRRITEKLFSSDSEREPLPLEPLLGRI